MEPCRPPARSVLARVVLLGAIAVVIVHLLRGAPRAVTVEIDYGAARRGLREATVAYRHQGDLVRSVTFRYPSGAPAVQLHPTRLPPGDLDVRLGLHYPDRVERRDRRIRIGEHDLLRLSAAP